jgi:hypothetical protein
MRNNKGVSVESMRQHMLDTQSYRRQPTTTQCAALHRQPSLTAAVAWHHQMLQGTDMPHCGNIKGVSVE